MSDEPTRPDGSATSEADRLSPAATATGGTAVGPAPSPVDHTPEPTRTPPAAPRPLRAMLAVTLLAGIALVVGTIGPPLFGGGVLLANDVLAGADPWRAVIDGQAEQVQHHGPVGDTIDVTYPMRTTFHESARDGDPLAWNPFPAGGGPLGATGANGVLGPIVGPSYLLLPHWYAPAAVKLLTMVAAAGFTFLFCRRLGTDRAPALFAGLAFAGSGFMVMWTNWSHVDVAAFIPALFWATERFLQRPRPATAGPVALAVAAMLLGNFPAVVGYALYLLVPYVIVRATALHGRRLLRLAGTTAGVGAAVVTGTLLVAVVLVPFARYLGYVSLGERAQTPGAKLGLATLVTSVAPEALGLSTLGPQGDWFGTHNQVEAVAFVGVTTAVLAVIALALPRPASTPRGAREVLAAATLLLGWAAFQGGELLRLLQHLPVFQDNFIGRTRSVLGFTVAVLAALGMQALVEACWPRTTRQRVRAALVALAVAAVAAAALAAAVDRARQAGRGDVLGDALVLPTVVGSLAVLAAGATGLGRRRLGTVALASLPVLLTVESLAFALPLLPNEDRDTHYPTTPGIELLASEAAGQRIAPEGVTLLGDAGQMFGLRTVTGHTFHAPTWKQALQEVDPQAFAQSATFSMLSPRPEVMSSPLLDRMAVRWWAGSSRSSPPGRPESDDASAATCDRTVELGAGAADRLVVEVPVADGLRGVLVRVCEADGLPRDAGLSVAVGDAVGWHRVRDGLAPGVAIVPVPADDLSGSGTARVELSLDDAGDGTVTLATGADGAPVVDAVRPHDDGLRLAYADDMRIYERTGAVERIRWAGRAETITDDRERLDRLSSGQVPEDTVVLSERTPAGDGKQADVEVTDDAPTRIAADVTAGGDGYLVVADSLQHSWEASVDGREVDLLEADHMGVAVPVAEGTHEVVLRHRPEGRRVGLMLSALALVVLVVVWSWDARRVRRDRLSRRTSTSGR